MTQPQPPASEELDGVLKRVHSLGNATENLFNRLYGSLGKRKKLTEAAEQLQKIEVRNRELRQALKEKSIETDRLHGILASVSEGIVMQDTEGRIVMMNSAAKELLGSQRNFWNTELGILFSESREIPTFGTELAPIGEATRVRSNGREISAQITAITTSDNERIGTLMILRDIRQDDLSQRMKDSFVTHISHELITPLAPMRIASEILLNTPEGQAPNQRMLEMIGKNVDILDRLVTEMLDMSAMTSGRLPLQYEALDLEAVLWDVLSSFDADLQDKSLECFVMLKNTDQLEITGDPKHIRWALSNLIRNAIQYSMPQQALWIVGGINADEPHMIVIDVRDQGVGISDTDLPHIFDLFYRGDARSSDGRKLDPRGLGQGLFVAKKVAEAHGGSLVVESRLYEGSLFRMRLPINTPRALPA